MILGMFLPSPARPAEASSSVAWMEWLSCFKSKDFAAYSFKDFTTKQEQQCNLRIKPNNTSFQIETRANPGHMYISESIFQGSRGQSREFLPPEDPWILPGEYQQWKHRAENPSIDINPLSCRKPTIHRGTSKNLQYHGDPQQDLLLPDPGACWTRNAQPMGSGLIHARAITGLGNATYPSRSKDRTNRLIGFLGPKYYITLPTPPPICPQHLHVTCASKVIASV